MLCLLRVRWIGTCGCRDSLFAVSTDSERVEGGGDVAFNLTVRVSKCCDVAFAEDEVEGMLRTPRKR